MFYNCHTCIFQQLRAAVLLFFRILCSAPLARVLVALDGYAVKSGCSPKFYIVLGNFLFGMQRLPWLSELIHFYVSAHRQATTREIYNIKQFNELSYRISGNLYLSLLT